MKQIWFALIVAVLLVGTSCNRDPKAVAQGYVQKGNRYFDAGKYKEASLMYRKALGKNKLSADAWYRLAQSEIRLGHLFPEGLKALQYSASLNPENAKAHLQLGEIYLAHYLGTHKESSAKEFEAESDKVKKDSLEWHRMKGAKALYIDRDAQAAVTHFEAADAASPSTPEIVYPLTQALIAANRAADAEKVARATIEKKKQFEPLYDVVAQLCQKSNRLPEAEAILKLRLANNPKSLAAAGSLARFYWGAKREGEMKQLLDRVASDKDSFPDGRVMASEFYSVIRDFDSAIRTLQQGIRDDAKRRADYQKLMARVLVAQNKKPEALALLGEVLKSKPDDAEAKALHGELLIDTDPAKAAVELQQAVAKVSTKPELRLQLARALMAKRPLTAQDIDQARFNYEQVIGLFPKHPQARLGLAKIQLGKRDFTGAIASVDDVLSQNPQAVPAKMLRGMAYAQSGNFQQARADFNDILKQNPQSTEASYQLAMVSMAERKFPEAEERFTKLRQAAPQELKAVLGLADTYRLEGKLNKTIELVKAEAERRPDQQNVLLLVLGEAQAASGNLDLAAAALKTATEKYPKSADAWARLGLIYRVKGQASQSVECLRKAREIQPGNAQIASELGISLERNGQRKEARDVYEDVLKTQPDHPVALNNLAYMIAETGGDLDRALMLAQKAKQRLPQSADVADTLGWIYIRKDLSDQAIDIFRDLVTRQPKNPSFQYHLAMALYQKGDKPQAKKALQSALQNGPTKDDETKIRELMAKIG